MGLTSIVLTVISLCVRPYCIDKPEARYWRSDLSPTDFVFAPFDHCTHKAQPPLVLQASQSGLIWRGK